MQDKLVPFEPVELSDDDLRAFGHSEEDISEWRRLIALTSGFYFIMMELNKQVVGY